jgi:branched-subunit amino acid transport protein
MNYYLLAVFLMLVTYIPRLLPFIFINTKRMPEKLSGFLSFIPYAALGALILPGGINAVEGHTGLSIAGLCLAAVLSWFKVNVVISMALTVAAIYPFM